MTPKPWYGHDGNKVFDVAYAPPVIPGVPHNQKWNKPFPFSAFWGPMAGLASTQWIADYSSRLLMRQRPDLTLVYLPHLDYDPQRHGPSG